MNNNAGEYFFELLVEEIPAWMLDERLRTLASQLTELYTRFTAGRPPESGEVVVGATSRRFFFSLRNLPKVQEDRQEEVKGPPRKVAYDAAGQPTAALLGFLKKNKLNLDSLSSGEGVDEYIRVQSTIKGAEVQAFLGSEVPGIVESLRWPRSMRWGAGTSTYIRPVHSVISLYEGTIVPIRIQGVESGRETVGHRILSNGSITVSSYEDYLTRLREAGVVADAGERVTIMRETANRLAGEKNGLPADEAAIWNQWKYLTEMPGVVRAEFDERFLSLPEEVLITVMRVHQKQLPIYRENRLTNSFLAVMDNDADPDGNAASGNAFVTNARFADARFFYETDRKRPLADRLPELSHLQFHEKLGDYQEKTRRIQRIVKTLTAEMKCDSQAALQAASLCKCDLVTEMVKEFTDLQGQIGGIYAREEHHPPAVWQAVYDHYRPLNLEGELPRSIEGAVVSVADKIDTLSGFFMAGMTPTGSKDPFGLRRAAQGIVQILLNRTGWEVPIPIDRLVELGLDGFKVDAPGPARAALREFFQERVRTLLQQPSFGLAYDDVDAAMAAGWDSLPDLLERALALHALRQQPQFISILDSARRIANIVGANKDSGDAGALEHETEKRLAALAGLVEGQIQELVAAGNYRSALESFAGLAEELEAFFRDVMVMVEDERLRKARLSLLMRIGSLAARIGDVTKIVIDRSELTASPRS